MADDVLQRLGAAAIQKLPLPLQRSMRGVSFRGESGPTQSIASGSQSGNLAGVIPGQNVVNVMDPHAFQGNADQLTAHEGTHVWQNNLPPTLASKIPADNASDPYNFGGLARLTQLRQQGGTILDLPKEQQAAVMQYRQSQGGDSAPANVLSAIDPYVQDMAKLPLSQIMPTDPNQKGINTMPRAPLPPMQYAQQTYTKGQGPESAAPPPPPGFEPVGDTPPPPAGFEPLPNGLEDYPVTQTGPKTFSGPMVSPQQSIVTDMENLGKGVAKGAANTLFNAGSNTPMPSYLSGSGYTDHANVGPKPDELNPQGFAQNLGYGGEQAAEFFAPAGVEGKLAAATTEVAPFLGKTLPKIGAQALTSGAVNAAQGRDFKTGAIAGGVAGGIGRAAEAVAPALAEKAIGARNVDRNFGRTPGQAIIQDTKGFRPRTVADSAQAAANRYTGQLDDAISNADQQFIQQPRIAGLLPAPKVEIPLGGAPQAPDMPGGLFDAQRFPAQNVGEARVIRNPNGQIMPFADRKVEFPDASGKLPAGRGNGGQFLTRQPTRKAFMTGADGEVGPTPEFSGPGVLLRDQQFPQYDGPAVRPYLSSDAPSLGPARDIISGAQQRSLPMKNALQPAADTLARDFRTGQAYPDNVLPSEVRSLKQQLSDIKKRWPIEDQTLGGDTIGQAYGALGNELDRTVPGSQELNQRISSLIPVADRASATDLNDNLLQRSLGRFGRPTGALAMAGLGTALGKQERGTEGAIEGGIIGLVAPEFLANPTTLMVGARGLNALSQPIARYTGGAAAQLFKPQKQQ